MPVRLPAAVPERLDVIATMTTSAPVWVLHGPGVGDEFVGRDHIVRSFPQLLWELFHANGYERIAFSEPSDPIYFLDHDSRTLSLPQAPPARPQVRRSRFPGPLGDRFVAGGRIAAPASRAPQPTRNISDPSRVKQLRALMADGPVRTAVVIVGAEDLLHHLAPDAHRAMASALHEWISGAPHRNLCVFLFSRPDFAALTDDVHECGYLPEFVNHLRRLSSREVARVPLPEQQEIARLLQVTRLRDRLDTGAFTNLGAVTRAMAAQVSTARAWRGELRGMAEQGVRLDLDALRTAGLVSGSQPDGRSAWERLDAMTGLAPVKEFVRTRATALSAELELRARGRTGAEHDATSPHLVFTGNPGTGKTTVAQLVGELYRDIGLLRRGHVVAPAVDQLVAGYVGQTAAQTRAMVAEAMDGVLFIDEAYRLSNQRGGFGQEAIDTLLTEMEQHRDRLVIIVAGYQDQMKEFLASNPGLRRRFPERNEVLFPDFEPVELHEILVRRLRGDGLDVTPELDAALHQVTAGLHRTKDKHFGNAGAMRELAAELKDRWAVRTTPRNGEPLRPATPEDIPERYRTHLDRGAVSIDDVLGDLDAMIGLTPVKHAIRELADMLALRKRRGRGMPVPPHMIFQGPPGTGKTTVARLVGDMLRALGLLAKGHLVEATRANLVAGYVGQTAPMTRAKIEEAMDGVLFIDEAYSLVQGRGGTHDFGHEAITELLYQMENLRGRIVVIAAGYPDDMARFLDANDGLPSRFTKKIDFPPYTSPELGQILAQFALRDGYTLAEGALARAQRWLEAGRLDEGPRFANARAVRNLMETMEGRLGRRVAGVLDSADDAVLNTITAQDVPEVP
jgi:SpoVK/Ycf46/Vps4 family AAA+-type ATPase